MRTLTTPGSGVKQSWAYAAGNGVVVAGWAAVGLGSGGSLPDRPAAGVHLVLAAVLLAIGFRSLHREGGTVSPAPVPAGASLARAFTLGVALMAGNLTSLVLYLPALQDLAPSGLAAFVLLVSLITLAPSLLPPVVLVLTGAWGRGRLQDLCLWTLAHQGQINAGLCFVFAAYLGRSGVARL